MMYHKLLISIGLIIICFTGIMVTGSHAGNAIKNMDVKIVKEGDLVTVNYTVRLEDGSLVYSTRPDIAQDQGQKRAIGYKAQATFQPEEITAGKSGLVPGVGQSVVGMKISENRKVTIPPELAFGDLDRRKIRTYPTVRILPRYAGMTPNQFVEQFGVFPIKGKEIQYTPFLKALVKDVTEHAVSLELIVNDEKQFKLDYGTVSTKLDKDEVVVTMTPLIGAAFKMGEAEGKITGSDGNTFTVDFNHLLAGKSIILDMELVSLTSKASAPASENISWIENHDKGLATAMQEKKPAVMVLYADWCKWCKKLLNETIPDPRIDTFRDRFVWIKVNSDNQKEIYTKYQQDGFPLVILFDREGGIVKKINGYANAVSFQEELRKLIEN
jgi:FKBP-type peptidyl-prolyl cis-trans isomerase 2